jgi:Ca-activated chloride channel homolog
MNTESQKPATPARPLTERELVALLEASRDRAPAPPAHLLDSLRADIPTELEAVANDDDGTGAARPRGKAWFLGALSASSTAGPWGSPALRIAAALVLLVGAGVLTFGVGDRLRFRQVPAPETATLTDPGSASDFIADPQRAEGGDEGSSHTAPLEERAKSEQEAGTAAGGPAEQPSQAGPASAQGALSSSAAGRRAAEPTRWWEALGGEDDRAAAPAEQYASGAERAQTARRAPAPAPATPPAARDAATGDLQKETEGFHKSVEQHNRLIDEMAGAQRRLREELDRLPPGSDARPEEPREFEDHMTGRRAELEEAQRRLEQVRAAALGTTLADGDAATADRPARTRIRPAPTTPIDRPTTPPRPSFDGMYFRDYGSHPFVDPSEDPLSTFGLDVDTGSYTVGRRYLSLGELPPAASVRVEEWVNFFDYGDPAPRRADLALTVEGARLPGDSDRQGADAAYLVRVGVKAREVASGARKSAVLVLLVDTSGSMARENRLGLVRQSLSMLLGELRDDDEVALVTYGSQARVVLPPTRDKLAVRRALDSLQAQGSTNLEHGMALAYELLARNTRPDALHRVILTSDGVANVGLTDAEALLRKVAEHAARGVELLAVGVGMGNYNDALLERLANRGDGAYAYVDSLQEARRVFVDELVGNLQSVAGDARIQVAFDPEVVASYRLVGYANRDLPDHAFRDPRTDAGEIGSGHAVSAIYEIALRSDAPRAAKLGQVMLRWRSRQTGDFVETSAPIDRARLAPSFERASASLRLAATVAELAEVLRAYDGTGSAGPVGAAYIDRLYRRSQALLSEFRGRNDVSELVRLIGQARDVAGELE